MNVALNTCRFPRASLSRAIGAARSFAENDLRTRSPLRDHLLNRFGRVLQITVDENDRIAAGVETLKTTLAETDPDVIVVIGDDHHEMFTEHLMPTFTLYCGETVNAEPPDEEDIFETVKPAAWALYGEHAEVYAVDAKLGRHILENAHDAGYDVAFMDKQADGQSIGHTFVTVRTRLSDGDTAMKPIVPVIDGLSSCAEATMLISALSSSTMNRRGSPAGRSGFRRMPSFTWKSGSSVSRIAPPPSRLRPGMMPVPKPTSCL